MSFKRLKVSFFLIQINSGTEHVTGLRKFAHENGSIPPHEVSGGQATKPTL